MTTRLLISLPEENAVILRALAMDQNESVSGLVKRFIEKEASDLKISPASIWLNSHKKQLTKDLVKKGIDPMPGLSQDIDKIVYGKK